MEQLGVRQPGRLVLLSVALSCIIGLGSCHSSKNAKSDARWDDPIYARREVIEVPRGAEVKASGAAKKVIEAACEWIGVPYLYGGNTRSGVDCSGLVCMAFESGAGVKLPRTSSEQAQWCREVERSNLRPADLVFFTSTKGGTRINHVAIYLGDGRIVHSTSSRGVIISNLSDTYWSEHFLCCGRALK